MLTNLTKIQMGILETLNSKWYESLLSKEIIGLSKLSSTAVYDSIKELAKENIVLESKGAYRINYSNDIAWAVKRLYDAFKVNVLPDKLKNKIFDIREKANLHFGTNILCILVFGSASSGELKENSDVDFLMILRERTDDIGFLRSLTSMEKDFNIIQYSQESFMDSYDSGDDFIISVLKNHLALQGLDYLRYFLERDIPVVSKKTIHKREQELLSLMKKIDKLLHENQPIAYDKIREFIKLKVRIMLMKSNIIPISRKNLFDLMKVRFKEYCQGYNKLTQKNMHLVYSKLR